MAYEEYPRVLYRGRQTATGFEVHRPEPLRDNFPHGSAGDHEWTVAIKQADAFNESCHLIVNNDAEKDAALAKGWCLDADAALKPSRKVEK